MSSFAFCIFFGSWAIKLFVAQSVERSLSILEIRGSSPVKKLSLPFEYRKDENKVKEAGNGPLKKFFFNQHPTNTVSFQTHLFQIVVWVLKMVRSEDFSLDMIRRRMDSVERICFEGPLRPTSLKDFWGVVVQCDVMPRFRFRRSRSSGGTSCTSSSSRP